MDFGDVMRRWEGMRREEARAAKTKQGPGKKANAPLADEGAAARGSGRAGAKASVRAAADAAGKAGAPRPEPDASGALERWLALHGVDDKDSRPEAGEDDRAARIEESARLKRLKPQAVLDLHGRTAAEARAQLALFLASSLRSGLEKVLVVHGKGIHSAGEPVVAEAVRMYLEKSDAAGAFGPAGKESGGKGATWVVLRRRDYFSR